MTLHRVKKIVLNILCLTSVLSGRAEPFHDWAAAPTMGWNSWDFYGTTLTEAQTKAQADYMATHLLTHGWDLITVDIQWYAPAPAADGDYYNYDTANADLIMDGFGRLQPAIARFPSAADHGGFTNLADYVHAKGLRFGIHIMRGIPKQAVIDDLPVFGTEYTAQDIADPTSTCPWNPDMYGVDMTRPGAQEYYDSLFSMYAAWGVDFIKVDDLSRPYHTAEIAAIRAAIDKTGRPIVFSTSPGETPVSAGEHVKDHVNQWRISDDFWDSWSALYDQFQRLHDWTPYRGAGYFPDADMLPLGKLHASSADTDGRTTHFSQNEQYTLMTLWSIARSPLIHGGDMTQMDAFTLSLMTNDAVIAVNQFSSHNRQLFRNGNRVAWVADATGSTNKYLAVFNTGNSIDSVPVDLTALGFRGSCAIRSLWDQTDLGSFSGTFSPAINPHGAALYRLSGEFMPAPWISDISAAEARVTLAWEGIDSVASYHVKRAPSETGPFATLISGFTKTTYTDTAVTNGQAYYYAVSAVVDGLESPDSNVRHAIPASATGIVSWNYNRYGDSPTGASPVAGIEPVSAPYWNDSWIDTGNSGTSMADLRDHRGGATPTDISWSASGTYSIQGSHPGTDADGTFNKEVLNGYLNSGGGAVSTVTFSQIPYASYDIYVYFSSDVAGRQGRVTAGTRAYYFSAIGAPGLAAGHAVFAQATNTTAAGYAEACNYARFGALTGSEQTVSCTIPDWGGIAAVQVVGREQPVINSVAVSNSMAQLNWSADTYGTYEVQSTTNLFDSTWVAVSGKTGLSGGSIVDTLVPLAGDDAEFFRINTD